MNWLRLISQMLSEISSLSIIPRHWPRNRPWKMTPLLEPKTAFPNLTISGITTTCSKGKTMLSRKSPTSLTGKSTKAPLSTSSPPKTTSAPSSHPLSNSTTSQKPTANSPPSKASSATPPSTTDLTPTANPHPSLSWPIPQTISSPNSQPTSTMHWFKTWKRSFHSKKSRLKPLRTKKKHSWQK